VSGLTCRFNVALAALAARAVSIGALPGQQLGRQVADFVLDHLGLAPAGAR
jgi:hypothetical protein